MAAKVIVVDDEAWIVDELVEALIAGGYECVGALSVDAAMETLEKDAGIRLVVTDLRMPGKSGIDLIVEARRAFDREFRFIVMSGHGSPSEESEWKELGIFDFVRKPFDIDALLESVGRAAEGPN